MTLMKGMKIMKTMKSMRGMKSRNRSELFFMTFTIFFMSFIPFTTFMSSQTNLSRDERAIVEYIDKHNDDAIALLERVVNINSGTQNLEGVRQVGAAFRAELDKLGFKTEWVD